MPLRRCNWYWVSQMEKAKFSKKFEDVKTSLETLLKDAEYLKEHASTIEEKNLADNLLIAIDNALDIAKN